MATITKRKDTFQISVFLGYDINGKKIRKTTTFKPPEKVTPAKAEKLAKEFAFEFEQNCKGKTELNENMRFSDLVDWYFDIYASNELKEITAYNYKSQLDNHVLPTLGNLKLKEISKSKITRLLNDLDLSHATVRKIYIIIQSIFTRAVEYDFVTETPCNNIILPKT